MKTITHNLSGLLIVLFCCTSLTAKRIESGITTNNQQTLVNAMPKPEGKQLFVLTEQDLIAPTLDNLATDISFTADGMHLFFQHVFNRPEYNDVIQHSLMHMYQMLEWAHKKKQPRTFYKSVFKLFSIKINGVRYFSCNELERALTKIADLIKPLFGQEAMLLLDETNAIEAILTERLMTDFALLKNNPNEFIKKTSESITRGLFKHESTGTLISLEQLRYTVAAFFNTAINKVIWSPQDHLAIWPNFEKVCLQLEMLAHDQILYQDDVDTLIWALIHRFNHFLNIAGSQLPISFYETTRVAMSKDIVGIDTIAEQEEFLTTKRQVLQTALMQGFTKAQGVQRLGLSL